MSEQINGDRKLTTPEAAEHLGLSPTTLTTWRCTQRAGRQIPYLKLGKRVLYRERDLDRWLDEQTVGATGTD